MVPRRYRLLLYITLFQVMMGFGIIMPVLPFYVLELGASSLEMGLMTALWAAGQFLFSPFWGALSDRIGRRPVILVGLVGFALTFLLMGLSTSIWMLLMARAVGGILTAGTIPAAQAYIADITDGNERARDMAGTGAAMTLGFLLGPGIGAILAFLGTHALFYTAAALGLIDAVATWLLLPEPPHRRTTAPRPRTNGLRAVRQAFRGPNALLYLLAFCSTFGLASLINILGFYLADRHGAGPGLTGLAMTMEGLASFLCQWLLVYSLSRRLGEERTIRLALLSGAAGFLAMILAPGYPVVVLGVVLVGASTSFIRPLIASLVSRRTTMEQGVTMGVQTAFDALGRSVGPVVTGLTYLAAWWWPFATATALYLAFCAWSAAQGATPAAEGSRAD